MNSTYMYVYTCTGLGWHLEVWMKPDQVSYWGPMDGRSVAFTVQVHVGGVDRPTDATWQRSYHREGIRIDPSAS